MMVRGINRQNIFEDREDYERFIGYLVNAKEKDGIKLLAFCLMTNHVHLLINTGEKNLGEVVKRFAASYASWFNRKYGRCGALFQDRFKSDAIESEAYLLMAVRYIHQNPVKAGICKEAADYKLSSFRQYLGLAEGPADTDDVLAMFSADPASRIKLFIEFSEAECGERFSDVEDKAYYSANALNDRRAEICGARSVTEFQRLSEDKQKQAVRQMRAEGISIRRIVRITGMSFGLVRRVDSGQ